MGVRPPLEARAFQTCFDSRPVKLICVGREEVDIMKTREDNRISQRAKMKEVLTKVPAKEGKVSKRNRRVFADKTNQQGRKKLEEEVKKIHLDERTSTRRSRRVLSNESNQEGVDFLEGKLGIQRKGKTIVSTDVDISRLENTNTWDCVKKDIEKDL